MIDKAIREIQLAQEQAYQKEKRYFEVMAKLLDAKLNLELKKSKLIRGGKIYGKKEDEREAQLIYYARSEYLAVKQWERDMYFAKAEYLSAKRAWESWQAICLLQSGV